jgi:hypothetical protein
MFFHIYEIFCSLKYLLFSTWQMLDFYASGISLNFA